MKGGNADELDRANGRLDMAVSLQAQHPDVPKVVRKVGRWQHCVDYRPFAKERAAAQADGLVRWRAAEQLRDGTVSRSAAVCASSANPTATCGIVVGAG